jgi:hypothetical protein
MRFALQRRLAVRHFTSEHAGWAEGSCVTSRRFHEVALRFFFSQLGPQLFVITGEAVASRSRLSPILMGWRSEQFNDFIKVLMPPRRYGQRLKIV